MRGLTLFLKDLSKCEGVKHEELQRINKELANIRSKFKGDKPLNGYQKKKYICKLVFIFLLGYKFDFGLIEAINLLSSNAYSEKQAGYLFISVVMKEDSVHMPLIISTLKNDLSSSNYIFQNLALRFIANSTSDDIKCADSLIDLVINMLLYSNADDSVKQSAVLTLLKFLRMKSGIILDEFKIKCLINLISHHDLGLVTASVSLVEFLTKKYPLQCESCVNPCIDRLSRILATSANDCQDYAYYSVAAPWITVKLLRILQNFPTILDASLRIKLRETLQLILKKASDSSFDKAGRSQHNNAKYAVIFEAISLIIQMDIQGLLLSRAFYILGATLQHKEMNLKCMALDMMTQLASTTVYLNHIKTQWNAVLNLLKSESDNAIKKQAAHLLYIICSECNVKPIVSEMINFLACEYDCTEEDLSKITSLAERFGIDRQWYFDVILKLFQIYGDKMSDKVWHLLIKVVADDGSIQEYAAKESYYALCENNCHDTVIKMTGYILGEFGYLIARHPQSDYKKQFNALKQKYYTCSSSTKALLLTSFMKFINIYPDLKDEVHFMLKDKRNIQNEDEEIQQRAVEYLKLSEIASRDLLATVLEAMPFSMQKASATAAKSEGKKSQKSYLEEHQRRKSLTIFSSHTNVTNAVENPNEVNTRVSRFEPHSNILRASSQSNFDLLTTIFKDTPIFNTATETPLKTTMPTPRISYIASNESFLHNLLFNEKAKLYENDVIVIVIHCDFKDHLGRFHLQYMNKTNYDLSDFCVQENFSNVKNKCLTQLKPIAYKLLAKCIIDQDMRFECLKEFEEMPSLNLKFLLNKGINEIKLMLPLTLNKFVKPGDMPAEAFAERWKNSEVLVEVVRNFPAKYPMIYGVTRQKLKGFRLAVIENLNFGSENFHCAGIFCTREYQMGFLVCLERYLLTNMYRSRVRSRDSNLSRIVSDLLLKLL